MEAVRVTWVDNGTEKSLVVFDVSGIGAFDLLYAAAGEVHIPIGPGAFGCKFEKAEDVVLYPKPKKTSEV